MIQFNSKSELYKYLNQFKWEQKKETEFSQVFFKVKYNSEENVIMFLESNGRWIEAMLTLEKYYLSKEEADKYVKYHLRGAKYELVCNYVNTVYRQGCLYLISVSYGLPFLPDELTIVEVLTESECIDYLLLNEQ